MTSDQKRVLVVDDDDSVVELLQAELVTEGYNVVTASDGAVAIETVRYQELDCVLLDISLGSDALPSISGQRSGGPDDGIEILRQIRKESSVPVIMLTGTDVEVVKVVALNLGADDYVTKPFGAREVVARVGAVLRRSGVAEAPRVSYLDGRLVVDRGTRTVTKDRQFVDLTPSEFDLLEMLSKAPGIALSRKRLLDRLRSTAYFGDERVIDVHIRHLRRKIEDDPKHPLVVVTVRGVGYRIGVEPDAH